MADGRTNTGATLDSWVRDCEASMRKERGDVVRGCMCRNGELVADTIPATAAWWSCTCTLGNVYKTTKPNAYG